jgi:DNA mismatch repair protein MutL
MAATPGRIHVLADEVINKIAAGEVVDRPASVLKELMENALDAGASRIEVELIAGGRTALVVADDGFGMSRDDALLSVERHATSKIRDVHDIEHVATLGFRGEALAAIASVSRFSLTTRAAETEVGTELLISGGRILEVRDAGAPVGTTMAVRNLFFNVPARRKFLRTEQTELAHARQVFLLYALSHPEVDLRLRVDDRDVYQLSGGTTLEHRVRELFGADLLTGLRPVSGQGPGISVHGLASLPQVTRGDRGEQYVFVNGRPASAPVVGHALQEAYQALIPRGRYPVLFLFIDVDAEEVDVNVHPTKKEVRFRQPSAVRDALINALRQAVTLTAPGTAASPGAVREFLSTARTTPLLHVPDLPALPAFAYPRIPAPSELAPRLPIQGESPAGAASATPFDSPGVLPAGPQAPWSWCRILGQVGGLYVVLETEDGMILMDPHAAHERINFERFMREVNQHAVRTQGLLQPEAVDLPPERALMVRRNLDLLRTMGFGISEFGGDTFLVDAMPVCLGRVSAQSILADVAASLDQGGSRGGTERWAEDRVAMAACKASVKAQDRLTVQEIEQLVMDLARAEMPYTCPHGRPTLIFMGFQELRRKFGRE